ncbi:putative methyltransferase DDB_G0268948 [Aplysia californica]|uniref:Methyltransferase DDB_G0268948 n=1 Tax=Aplysia californica TaxID=6500 RepID=A0ABM0ZUR4_APLCA|nr:putative methyltransferase DDB_G0268948 [Aplysia californica]
METVTPDNSQFYSFKDTSDLYIKYRPTYPERLYEKVIKFCQESETCTWELAVDVACGSGQSTLPLAKLFKQVIAVDSSEKQISQAPRHMCNISFRCGSAYNLKFISSGSVDLVTVATAFHWLDPERFFEEADRILKPGGSLILYSFGTDSFTHHEADRYIQYLNISSKYVAKYHPATEKLINRYRDVTLPYPGWRRRLSANGTLGVCGLSGFDPDGDCGLMSANGGAGNGCSDEMTPQSLRNRSVCVAVNFGAAIRRQLFTDAKWDKGPPEAGDQSFGSFLRPLHYCNDEARTAEEKVSRLIEGIEYCK